VLAAVQENIDEPVPDFPWCLQRPGMVPIGPNSTGSAEAFVDRLGESNAETLHAARERRPGFRLDEEVHMVRLNAEVHDSERGAGRVRESSANFREEAHGAQRAKSSHRPQGHVDRVSIVMDRSSPMGDAGPRSSGFTSGSLSAASPGTEPELALSRLAPLDLADIIEIQQTDPTVLRDRVQHDDEVVCGNHHAKRKTGRRT